MKEQGTRKKNYMKKTISILALVALILASCSQEDGMGIGEEVKMTFTAKLDVSISSRTETHPIAVNKVVCAVFTKNGETELMRDIVDFTNGEAKFEPTLMKSENYHIVFWAYKGDSEGKNAYYDMSNLKAIKFNPSTDLTLQDAEVFTETLTNFTIDGHNAKITLKRPLAQVNIATTDWAIAQSNQVQSITSELAIKDYNNVYNALTKEFSRTSETVEAIYTLAGEPTEIQLELPGNEKISGHILATGYVFGGEEEYAVTCTLNVKANGNETVIDGYEIPEILIKPNRRTNIYSNWLTKGGAYNISQGQI